MVEQGPGGETDRRKGLKISRLGLSRFAHHHSLFFMLEINPSMEEAEFANKNVASIDAARKSRN